MWCVGLTGGIGSGKSTVAHCFAKLGITIIDADVIAREATSPGSPGLAAIVGYFGSEMLTQTGELNRPKLRDNIFADPAAKAQLEKILHPLIVEDMRAQVAAAPPPYCLAVIPLLAESVLTFDFLNRICVVDVSLELQQQRAAQRDQVTASTIAAIMATQSSRKRRLQLADDIILNHGNLNDLEIQVKKLHSQYLQLAGV